jgi:hypothetical protein
MKVGSVVLWLGTVVAVAVSGGRVDAQTPRAAAPVDLTGYWVSVVTTEWRYRMMTPPKGDYDGIPLNDAARKVADAWDPARSVPAGEACRAYGAPAVLHLPTRLHIVWADDSTLRIDVDQGTQTRLLRFGPQAEPPARAPRTWQGQSVADWQLVRPTTGAGPPSVFGRSNSLKVITTGLRSGYLRRNGVPYSENAVLTEYFDVVPGPGADWLIVTVLVDDPQYLTQPLLRSVQFKRQADATGWEPTPCAVTW